MQANVRFNNDSFNLCFPMKTSIKQRNVILNVFNTTILRLTPYLHDPTLNPFVCLHAELSSEEENITAIDLCSSTLIDKHKFKIISSILILILFVIFLIFVSKQLFQVIQKKSTFYHRSISWLRNVF